MHNVAAQDPHYCLAVRAHPIIAIKTVQTTYCARQSVSIQTEAKEELHATGRHGNSMEEARTSQW